MYKYKVGVISDTHGMIRPEVEEALKGCSLILHAGDINRQVILDHLRNIAPVIAVRGNNDWEWAEHIPETVQTEVYGIQVFMIHNKKYLPRVLQGINLVISGHTHKYEEKEANGITFLNPGSCGPRRFGQEISLAILKISDHGTFEIEKVEI